MILHILPIRIGKYQYTKKISNETLNFLVNQNLENNQGNKKSRDSYLLNNSLLLELKNFFIEKVYEYLKEFDKSFEKSLSYDLNDEYESASSFSYPYEVYITNSWLNFNKKGDYHHIHCHPNSFISGVFYLQVEPNNGYIRFHNSSIHTLKTPFCLIGFDETGQSTNINVQTNELLLFPSTLQHSVDNNDSEQDRISLSFNTFVKGKFGSSDNLNELILT